MPPWSPVAGEPRPSSAPTRCSIQGKQFTVGDTTVKQGDWLSLDGTTGEVMVGKLELAGSKPPQEFDTILKWADAIRKGKLGVRANADTGEDAANARAMGAEGIGLCRTEHMFLAPDRLPIVREMILADTPEEGGGGAREAAHRPAGRLRGDPRGDGRAARHGAPARSAAARVPAVGRGAEGQGRRQGPLGEGAGDARRRRELGRAQPDDRHPRRAARRDQARAVRDAGAGAARRRRQAAGGGQEPDRRDHDPAHRHARRDGARPLVGRGRDRGGVRRASRSGRTSRSAR